MTMQDIPQELLLDFIQSRTSCRAFTADPVSKEDLRRILDCALAAPSGQGLQTWQFTAVTDPEKIRRLFHRRIITSYNSDNVVLFFEV